MLSYRLGVCHALVRRPLDRMPRLVSVSQPGEQPCAGLMALGGPQVRVDREQPSPSGACDLITPLVGHLGRIPRSELLQTGLPIVSN